MDKKLDKRVVIGIAAGVAGVTAGAIVAVAVKTVVDAISYEMKNDTGEQTFTSPDGNHTVALNYGTSVSANGLTRIKVVATTEGKEDECKLTAYARKSPYMVSGEWIDNDHFKLLIGCMSRKQCCDVTFTDNKITAKYYLCKSGKNN